LTRDPIGLAGGYLNLRSYLGNRPADALDVWGEYAGVEGAHAMFWDRKSVLERAAQDSAALRAAEENRVQRAIAELEAERAEIIDEISQRSTCVNKDEEKRKAERIEEIDDELYSYTTLGRIREIATEIVGAIPIVSEVQSGVEVISGRDYISGQKASRWVAGGSLTLGLIPFGKTAGKRLMKAGAAEVRTAIHEGESLTKNVTKNATKRAASSPSYQLGKALEKAGVERPAGTAAHHIVPTSAAGGEKARQKLASLGIDLNDAVNGVFLPANKSVANPTGAAVHSTLHTTKYYQKVAKIIENAETKEEAEAALNMIRNSLLNGGL
jgi:hypothetical protein